MGDCKGGIVNHIDYTCLLRQECGYPCALCAKCALQVNFSPLEYAFKETLKRFEYIPDTPESAIIDHVTDQIDQAYQLMTALHRIRILRDMESMSQACSLEWDLMGGTDLTEQVIASVDKLDEFENWDGNQMAASIQRRILDLQEPMCTDKDCPVHGKNIN